MAALISLEQLNTCFCNVFFPVHHKLHLQMQGTTRIIERFLFVPFNMIATRTHLFGHRLLHLVRRRGGQIVHPFFSEN